MRENARWCVYGGEVDVAANIVKPTIFVRPLRDGPSLKEFFAPVFVIQPYEADDELARYFEDPAYRPNAMYICLFGRSDYVEGLVRLGLHTRENILHDTDLHAEERGWRAYGGLGPGASCVYINDSCFPGATLPQRDIYRHLVQPVAPPAMTCAGQET